MIQFVGFNEKEKSPIIKSNEALPIRHNHYAVSPKDGKRTLLDSGIGTHHAQLSATGAFSVRPLVGSGCVPPGGLGEHCQTETHDAAQCRIAQQGL